ncbi:hypothetical protein CLF_101955, partial [Clonorchis sinensis]
MCYRMITTLRLLLASNAPNGMQDSSPPEFSPVVIQLLVLDFYHSRFFTLTQALRTQLAHKGSAEFTSIVGGPQHYDVNKICNSCFGHQTRCRKARLGVNKASEKSSYSATLWKLGGRKMTPHFIGKPISIDRSENATMESVVWEYHSGNSFREVRITREGWTTRDLLCLHFGEFISEILKDRSTQLARRYGFDRCISTSQTYVADHGKRRRSVTVTGHKFQNHHSDQLVVLETPRSTTQRRFLKLHVHRIGRFHYAYDFVTKYDQEVWIKAHGTERDSVLCAEFPSRTIQTSLPRISHKAFKLDSHVAGVEAATWLEQPGSIPALVQPSGGMAARHRKGVTAERPPNLTKLIRMNDRRMY